jgi:glycosyltransferase involved in cell wall biosynthesis
MVELENFDTAIILATFNPNIDFFIQQLDSIKNQTYTSFHVFIQDDGSDNWSQIELIIKNYPFISFEKNLQQIGVYKNFERGLIRSLKSPAKYFFFCDQDDIWLPNKLYRSIEALNKYSTQLIHSDAFTMNEKNLKICDSLWELEERDIKNYSVQRLLFRNSVMGCSSCFTRGLAEKSIPFPINNNSFLHDAWLAVLAAPKIHTISEPLLMYRQHSTNVIGAKSGRKISMNSIPRIVSTSHKKVTGIITLQKSIQTKISLISILKTARWNSIADLKTLILIFIGLILKFSNKKKY